MGQARKHSVSFRLMWGISIVVTAVMATGFYWDMTMFRRQVQAEVRSNANVLATQLISLRYVMAANQDRINTDSQGRTEFKHLNPAAVGRLVAEHFNARTDIVLKQTRLQVRAPGNQPDEVEVAMLEQLAASPDLQEIWVEEKDNGRPYFRYMVPLKTEKPCLNCHGEPKGEADIAGYPKEGLHEGDLAGAISIRVPTATYYQEFAHRAQSNLGLALLTLGLSLSVIYFIMSREVAGPLAHLTTAAQAAGRGEWDAASSGIVAAHAAAGKEIAELATSLDGMTGEIRASQIALEERVEQRTRQLHEANQELARARQFQADFLAAVSHDLRTPLTSIIAQAEVLLAQDMGRLTRAQEEFLRDILGSGRDLVTMINDLLDLAKIEAGKSELSLEDCDPANLIGEAVGFVRPLAERTGLTVESRMGALPVVCWDRQKVRRVLLNLLSNAVKFTPAGGAVSVTAECAELRGQPAVRIDVTDTGVGIAPEDQAAVFDAYRQVGKAAKGTMGGTGLGLPLARQLVELHGGILSLQSQVGQGSTFTVLLPVSRAKGGAA